MSQIDGSKCSCGRVATPARRHCPDCRRVMAPTKLDPTGVVETHTTIHVPPEGFEGPVHVGVVRIQEGARAKPSVRVLARSKAPLETGQKVGLAAEAGVVWAEPA